MMFEKTGGFHAVRLAGRKLSGLSVERHRCHWGADRHLSAGASGLAFCRRLRCTSLFRREKSYVFKDLRKSWSGRRESNPRHELGKLR